MFAPAQRRRLREAKGSYGYDADDTAGTSRTFGSLFDDFFNDAWTLPAWAPASRMPETSTIVRARMDVTDKGEKFEIKVDLPGVKKEDIEVAIEGNRVSISATVKEEKEVKEGEKRLHAERFLAPEKLRRKAAVPRC